MLAELRNGQKLTWNGHHFQVYSQDEKTLVLISERTRTPRNVLREELEAARDNKEVDFETPPIDPQDLAVIASVQTPFISNQLQRRRWYVDALLLEGVIGSRKVVAEVIERVSKQKQDVKPPSVTSVYGWARDFKQSQFCFDMLVPRHAGKGNRKNRVSEQLLDLFYQTMDDFYLQPNRPTMKAAHEWLGELIIDTNQQRKSDRLRNMSYNAFTDFVRLRVDPYWQVRRREGVKAATRKFRGTADSVITTYSGERIEVDHTILDVNIVDPSTGEVIGRPTFTWALDHYSRVILGVMVSLLPPSAELVCQCLHWVLQDKTPHLHTIDEKKTSSWDQHCIPRAIVVDNGAEFHGHAFKSVCERYKIDIQYCPPGKPWFKGRTERFVRTINMQLIHLLPGTTRSNSRDRGDYKSEQLACLTLVQVQDLIWRYISTQYHESRHSVLGKTPRQAWIEGQQDQPVCKLADPRSLVLDLSLSAECTISGDRVQYRGLRYQSPVLNTLALQLKGKSRKVTLLVNSENVYRAWIKNPLTNSLLEVTCRTHGVTDGMTYQTFKLMHRAGKETNLPRDLQTAKASKDLQRDVQTLHANAVKNAEKERKQRKNAPRKKPEPKPDLNLIDNLNKKEQRRVKDHFEKAPKPHPVDVARPRGRFDHTDEDIAKNHEEKES